MASKNSKGGIISVVFLLLLGLIAFTVKTCKQRQQQYPPRILNTTPGDWRSHKLTYTKHARCRMKCRHITEAEVEHILASGVINEQKSKEEAAEAEGNCDTYALEGNTADGQHVRIIFGACPKITKVITAIDLENEYKCNCR
jgi:hypothetical protein